MPDEILESEGLENETDSVGIVSDGVLSDSVPTVENTVESAEDIDSSNTVDFPSDYLDKQTFNDGVVSILEAMEETEEEIFVSGIPSYFALSEEDYSYNSVVFDCNGVLVYFPSGYAEDVTVKDGMLVNYGANYTLGCVLDSASVSNYLNSEITVPTYHSATWYQYLAQYGQPYRVVDRYINSYGSLSSSTRESVDLEFSGGNDWAGFGLTHIMFLLVCVFLGIRAVISWLK